jgi:putative redox protein
MADVTVTWTGEQLFQVADKAGHTVLTGMDDRAPRPTSLLLGALASCAGVDLVTILAKKRQKVTGIEAHLTKESAPEPPWTIVKIEIEWVIRGHKLSEKAVTDAVHLAEEKYCSVAASLKSEIVTTIRLVEEGS